MNRGRCSGKARYSSTMNPGGTVSDAPSGFAGSTVGLLRADSVANGSGKPFQLTGSGFDGDCATTAPARRHKAASDVSSRVMVFSSSRFSGARAIGGAEPLGPVHDDGNRRR